jgi:glycosyltransferase involved in cell wall biosynthesis
MRILFLEPCPKGFGGYHRAWNAAVALAAEGHTVTMVYYGRREPCHWSREQIGPNLTLIELPTVGRFRLAKLVRILYTVWIAACWRRDIFHVFTSVHPENVAAILICRLLCRRFVADWDDYWQDTGMYRHGSRLARAYIRRAEELGPRRAAGTTAASDFLADEAQRLGCGRVHKLLNGCPDGFVRQVPRDEARRLLHLPPDEPVLFAFGHGFAHGRAPLLLECAQHLSAILPAFTVLTNADMGDLWSAARAGPRPAPPETLACRFRSVGYIAERDIGLYTGAADFALFLVADVPAERACSPIRVTAYLGGECPIATTDVPTEARRLVAAYGCGVIGADAAAVARGIAAAWRDPARMAAMKAGARAARESLAYDRIARDLAAFYASLLRGVPRP